MEPYALTDLRKKAERAAQLVMENRDHAETLAAEVLDQVASVDDPTTESIAAQAMATVHLHRGRPDLASTYIDQSLAAAERVGEGAILGAALLTHMAVLAMRGKPEEALLEADRAESMLDGDMTLRLRIQRATVLGTTLGRADEAINQYDLVLQSSQHLDPHIEVVVRSNRGLQLLRKGDLVRCVVDLRRARSLYEMLGNSHAADETTLHLAQAAARQGDIPTVFSLHSELADRDLFNTDDPRAAIDWCDALLTAGLISEAGELAERAVVLAEQTKNTPGMLEGIVKLSEVKLARGQLAEAVAASNQAIELGSAKGHSAWVARAIVVRVAARVRLDGASSAEAASLNKAIGLLENDGWQDDAIEARIALSQLYLELGQPDKAADVLPPDPALAENESSVRARVRQLRALRMVAVGDTASARRELARALRELDIVRSQYVADDIRSASSDRAVELARLGLELAIHTGRPRSILDWAERQRGAALRLALPQAVNDPRNRAALDRLRSGESIKDSEVAALERRITYGVRGRRAARQPGRRATTASEIVDAVGQRTLIEFVQVGSKINAVVVRRGRVRYQSIEVDRKEVATLIYRLQFGLRRLATATGERTDSAMLVVDAAAAALDELLLKPILASGDDSIIIVPTGELHQLPWSAIPELARRATTIAPSAHLWSAAETVPMGSAHSLVKVGLVAGPDLPFAHHEVAKISAKWQQVTSLSGPDASIDQVMNLFAGSDVAHLVTHGNFRSDAAQFSSLQLADGPLMIHDLERLERLPPLVILSACSLAQVDVGRADDILGFPAALFSRGVRTLVASLLPVSDEATWPLMVDLHGFLAQGQSPATALCNASATAIDRGPADRAAANSFAVLGHGG